MRASILKQQVCARGNHQWRRTIKAKTTSTTWGMEAAFTWMSRTRLSGWPVTNVSFWFGLDQVESFIVLTGPCSSRNLATLCHKKATKMYTPCSAPVSRKRVISDSRKRRADHIK
ncbi:unnamed protein product [Symbiodinium sp. CCMP2592]|nr:unnamed protein product [Symbiodinium sp. CCMP2592]